MKRPMGYAFIIAGVLGLAWTVFLFLNQQPMGLVFMLWVISLIIFYVISVVRMIQEGESESE